MKSQLLAYLTLLGLTLCLLQQQQPEQQWVAARVLGRRANQLFILASSYGIARARGAKWCIRNLELESLLGKLVVFNATPHACPHDVHFEQVSENGRFQHFLPEMLHTRGNVEVGTYLQSFKYFEGSGVPFRLAQVKWARDWVALRNVQVGIHVRRGDMLLPGFNDLYNVPSAKYFENAIERLYLMAKKSDFNFVVCTDDVAWVLAQPVFAGMTVLEGTSPDEDLSIIAACRHVIMSVGTFGWWATYMKLEKDGYSFYYDRPFKTETNSVAAAGYEPADHFPREWIPVSEL